MINCDNKWTASRATVGWMLMTIAVLVNNVNGQSGSCSSEDISSQEFQYGIISPESIAADFIGTIIEYDMQNTLAIASRTNVNMNKLYIDATIDQETNVLRIFTTDEYANFEEEQIVDEISLSLELTCTTGAQRLLFRQRITDSNNHDPVFNQTVYEIELQLPLPMGFDLTFFQEISARDIDIRNNSVTFSSTDSGIIVVGTSDRSSTDGKTFYATLKADQQLLNINGRMEFTITGTDNGIPPRSGQATVILTSDELNTFIPIPRFEKALYMGTLSSIGVLQLENVIVVSDTFSNEIAFGLSGGDSDLFAYDNDLNTVTISLVPNADVTDRTFLMTTLIANRANVETGSTVVHVNVEVEATIPTPSFQQPRYRAQLDDNQQVTIDTIALVPSTYSNDVVFFLEGDDEALFEIIRTENENQVTLTLAAPLTEELLLGKTLLLTTIGAYRGDNLDDVGYSAILVDVPTTTPAPIVYPTFEKSIYRGNLDSDRQLIIENVILILDTFSEDIVFTFQDGDDYRLFNLANTGNTVTITLVRELLDEDTADKSVLIVTVIATRANGESGSTTILVDVPPAVPEPIIPVPTFEKADYSGTIDEDLAGVTIEPIVLNISTYNSSVTFTLEGGDRSLFAIANTLNTVTLTLANPLTDDDLLGRTFFLTVLVANLVGIGSGYTILRFDTPVITPEPIQILPAFEKPSFRGSLDEERLLTFETVIVNATTYSEDIVFELTEGDHALFQTTNVLNEVTVTLLSSLTETDVDGRSYFTTILNAHKPNVGSAATVLLVNIPVTTPRPAIPVPAFERPQFSGSFDIAYTLTMEDIVLIETTYSQAVSFSFEGEDSGFFVLSNTLNIVTITLRNDVTEDLMASYKQFLTFNVIASHPETTSGNTSVLIGMPEKICPVNMMPIFENKVYSFWLKPDSLGIIGSVLATVEADTESVVSYQLEITDTQLTTRLSVDPTSGALLLSSPLPVGSYTCRVVATTTTSAEQGAADIQITIEEQIDCSGGTSVEKSLIIQYLVENVAHANILPVVIGICTYRVVQIIPNDQEYVQVNSETNQLTSISFDRESEAFIAYEVPQIQVTLQLSCDGEEPSATDVVNTTTRYLQPVYSQSRFIEPGTDDGRWYVLASDMVHSARTTVLTIIIEDENDNEPVFLQPLAPIIGYPDATVAEQIMPAQVTAVLAVDSDAGLNAKVRYSLATVSENFLIDAETGILSPRRDAFKTSEQETIDLIATDRDGASDGHSTSLQLIVKKLEPRHITVITIEEEELEAVDLVLNNIYAELGLNLAVLHSAIISLGDSSSTAERNAGNKYLRADGDGGINALRLFVYSIDTANEFMNTADVQRKLLELNTATYALSSVGYENIYKEIITEEANPLVLIIVCSVLGVLLLGTVLCTFLMWWYKIRPYEYKQMLDGGGSLSSQQELRSQADGDEAKNTSPVLSAARFNMEKKSSLEIRGNTLHETADDEQQIKLAKSLADGLESTGHANGDVPKPKPKGIRFNEMVERIDIEVEAEADDQRL